MGDKNLHNPSPCILIGWPLCMEWASFGATIAPQDSFWHILLLLQNSYF